MQIIWLNVVRSLTSVLILVPFGYASLCSVARYAICRISLNLSLILINKLTISIFFILVIFIICCGTLEDILGERKNKIYQKLSTLTLMKKPRQKFLLLKQRARVGIATLSTRAR